MIADDMMTFVKNDIVVFGGGVFSFIVFTLWFVFRSLLWVFIPLLSCFFKPCNDWLFRFGRMESNSHILKFYCINVNFNNAINIHMSVRYLQYQRQSSFK